MEKQTRNIFYIGISDWKEECQRSLLHFLGERKPLEIYKQTKLFACENGFIQLYFSLLPTSFEQEIKKKRGRKKWFDRLIRTLAHAEGLADIKGDEDVLFSERLSLLLEKEQEIPNRLFKVRLKEIKERLPLTHINISLPDECGPSAAEKVIELLDPYLSNVNFVTFVGEENQTSWLIEDYLYEEYGIVMSYGKRPEKNALWIDYAGKERPLLCNYARENGIYCLNSGEVLNFLDTTVKNGYNTKVN